MVFGELPNADPETALKMFEKAETIEPGFYSKNKVVLAQVLYALDRDLDRARRLCEEVINKYKCSSKWDDKEVRYCRIDNL